MDHRLRITAGPDKGLTYNLPPSGVYNVGKLRQHNEICLHDMKVSRVHCEIQMTDDRVVVTDLDSDLGTFVCGERVTQRQLRHGDILKIGDTEFTYESVGSSAAPPAPAPIAPECRAAPVTPEIAVPLSPPSVPAATRPGSPIDLDEVKKLAHTKLGQFQLGDVLGTGYCGVTFRARHVREGRDLALKVLHPEFPQKGEEASRFSQVWKERLPVRHPNLITVFGVGRNAPYTWMALEFVEGESLAQMISGFAVTGVPRWPEAFRLTVHLARALHCAHRHQMPHRNLAPANVLFRSVDSLYKLNDLPLVKALAGCRLRQATLRSKVAAELGYSSPEQIDPQARPDVRSDLYSTGALAYTLLMGRPPFGGKTPVETLAQIKEATPASPRQLQPAMPEIFEAALLRLLAKRPEDRFACPSDLLAELAKVTSDPA